MTSALSVTAVAQAAPPPQASRVLDQLTSENSVVLMLDFQPMFVFSTRSIEVEALVNNAAGLIKAARVFKVPTIITTVTAPSFAGPLLYQLQAAAPDITPIDRTVINAWSDSRVADAVRATKRKKIIMAGLWTDNCVMLPALSALAEGYEVYFVTDASGDYDKASHERAIQRLVQAGAVPITWLPVMLEWQTDWARTATAGAVSEILKEHAPAIGIGAQYQKAQKQ